MDELEDFQGPLAGVSSALKACFTRYLLVLPCDSPLIDEELIDNLISRMGKTEVDICVAHDGSIMHATFAIIEAKLSKSLEEFLESGGRKMALWYRQHSIERIDVSSQLEVLTNLNRPEDFNI
jgi:molybdopterin-guanine dinucleotide biosynthesis protein A